MSVENIAPGALSDEATLRIEVEDVNEFEPVFNQDLYEAAIVEESSGEFAVQASAIDLDVSANVTYELQDFTELFSIDQNGNVFTTQRLDREEQAQYNFTVAATDNSQPEMVSLATVFISLVDINDNQPLIAPFNNLTVPETTATGTAILLLSASDPDAGENGTIARFSLAQSSPSFAVSTSGVLTVTSMLDALITPRHVLTILASDSGIPRLTSTATLVVDVQLSAVPFFEQPFYLVSISENNLPDTFLVQVTALSRDPSVSITEYVLDPESDGVFAVEPDSGNVSVLAGLDRESQDFYSITVEALAEVNGTVVSVNTVVNVTVEDENDNPPVFTVENQTVSIPETAEIGSFVFAFQTSDADILNNSVIQYSITVGNDDMLFTISDTGNVSTTSSLLSSTGTHNLSIEASNPPEVGALSSTAQLVVTVTPVNDFAPVFDMDVYITSVNEDATVGSLLLTLVAMDSDLGTAGDISFNITAGDPNEVFAIGSTSGQLTLNAFLDFEIQTSYNITISAADGGIPRQSSIALVDIQVIDVNDVPPVFTQALYNGSIFENDPPGQTILTVETIDADSAPNAQVTFDILSNLTDLFEVTDSGEIRNLLSLDRETASNYSLVIQASNNGSGVLFTTITLVEVTVLDLNDNTPQFSEAEYGRVLQAPIAANTTVVEVQATDLDVGLNGAVQFSIVDLTNTFTIDPLTGLVSTSAEVESEGNFTVTITASDSGTPPLSNQTQLLVIVLRADDLTAGRENDFIFSTDSGLSLVNAPSEIAVDSYQQQYGFAIGRNVRESRSISASLGPLSDSITVSPTSTAPESLEAVLVTTEVWHDDPQVRVVLLARDSAHNTPRPTSVIVQITHPDLGTLQSSCETSTTNGMCTVTASLPSAFFNSAVTLDTTFGLSVRASALQFLGSVAVQQRPEFDIGSDIYVFADMPFRQLFPGDGFSVPVYGEAGTSPVGSYTINVRVSPDLMLFGLIADSSQWQAQTMSSVDGSQTITAVRADQTTIPQPGQIELFSITAQVSESSRVDMLIDDVMNVTVGFLGDFSLARLLPFPGEDFVLAAALSRNGISQTGAVFVAEDRTIGLLPFSSQVELVNTAVLDGSTLTFPVTVFEVHLSGAIAQSTSASCVSGNTAAVDVSTDCSNLLLTQSQTQPTVQTAITVTQEGFEASLPVRTWVPLFPITLTASDATLNLINGVLNPTSNCSAVYQQAFIKGFADFTDSQTTFRNIDVTEYVTGSLSSSDAFTLGLFQTMVLGFQPGSARISYTPPVTIGTETSEVAFTITDTEVTVLGLDVQVATSLQISGDQIIDRLSTTPLTVNVEQVFDFEGVQGSAIASAVFSDSTRFLLLNQDVIFSSLNVNAVQVSGGSVTAIGSAQGQLVQAEWFTLCSSEPIATGLAQVTVDIPLPSDIRVEVQFDSLSQPASTASVAGVPTSTAIVVTAVYADRTQELSVDNRTVYSLPDGVTLSRNGIAIISVDSLAQTGSFVVQVSFSQFPTLERNVTITIVSVMDIAIEATPFPFYPGSNLNPITALHPIATTGSRQQALLTSRVLLSTGDSIDISSLVDLQLALTATSPELQGASSISQSNVLAISDVSLTGMLTVSAGFREIVSSTDLVIEVTSSAVEVASIAITPFPANTFRGIVNTSTHQVVVSATFTDNTQYVNLFQDLFLANLVTLSATPSSSIAIGSASGVAVLRGNSLAPAVVTVSAVSSLVEESLSVACNLEPDIGDVDLGSLLGVPIPSQSVGSIVTVPVRVNSGTLVLDSIELDITFDPTILRALSASTGPNWPSTGVFQFTVNDPIDIISIGGTLVGSNPVVGPSLYLADIQFEVLTSGVTDVSGTIHTLAQQANGNTPASNIVPVPVDFIAGSVQFESIDSGRRRRSDAERNLYQPQGRTKRQSSSCMSPPCDICNPSRETGDVDGNCIFDVRDASFLQLYYLTTITTGSPPELPPDQSIFLDIDLNGDINPNDVIFMLRVNFRLLRFLTTISVTPVETSSSTCQLSINVTLLNGGDSPADPSSTAVVLDLAHEDADFQAMFDGSNFTSGSVLAGNKGPGLFGGLVEAVYLGGGVYGVSAQTEIAMTDIGLSIIQVTFDGLGNTSSIRTGAMFSQSIPRYGRLDLTFPLRTSTVAIQLQTGYAPLTLFNNTQTSADCIDQQSPLRFEQASYQSAINESAPVGTSVVQVLAISNRPGAVITYSLNSTTALPFVIGNAMGEITVSTPGLDFEAQAEFVFDVLAVEGDGFSASTQVTVNVLNANDLPPVLDPLGTIETPAFDQPTILFQVNATDPDFLGSLTHSITTTTAPGLIAINSATGVVSSTASLLPVANSLIQLEISVFDGVFTASDSATVDVFLPMFSQELYTADLSELTPVGSSVLQTTISNGRNEVFTFAVQDPSFSVISSGTVFIAAELDREAQTFHLFNITATSTNFELRAIINITITDENDNPPMFSQPSYDVTIPASTPVGSSVLTLTATDIDQGTNAAISYSISPDNLFTIDSTTGVLSVGRSILGLEAVLVLTATAVDSGSPAMNQTAIVNINITAVALPSFPIAPEASTTGTVLALGDPQTNMNDSIIGYSQTIDKLSGPNGQLSATFRGSSISANVVVSTALQQALTATVSLLRSSGEVYQDDRQIQLAVQVRDEDHSTRTSDPAVLVRAVFTSTGESVTSQTCSVDAASGLCVVSVDLPVEWFDAAGGGTVELQPLLNGSGEGVRGILPSLSLQPVPSISVGITNQVLLELPLRGVYSGESFLMDVYGYSTFTITGFALVFELDSALTVQSVIIDSTQWSLQSTSSGNQFGVSAILATPADEVNQDSRRLLFSVRLTAVSTIATEVNVSIVVQSLSNAVEGSVALDGVSSTAGQGLVLDRSGVGTVGVVYIAPNDVVALFAYTAQSELVNTAVFDGGSEVSAPVLFSAGYVSGVLLSYNGAISCISSNTSVVNVDASCGFVMLFGNETSGSDEVSIIYITPGGVSVDLPLRVFHPVLPLSLDTSDATLNRIQFSLSDTCTVYQQSTLSVFANLVAGPEMLSAVDVTNLVALVSNDSSVLGVSGDTVAGVTPGFAQVCVNGRQDLGCAMFEVSDDTVNVGSVVGSLLVDLAFEAPTIMTGSTVEVVAIGVCSELQFEQERGDVLTHVLYNDGTIATIDVDEVILLPPDSAGIYSVEGRQIVALADGESNAVFVWRPGNGTCGVDIPGSVPVTISLPLPTSLTTSLLPPPTAHTLTTSTDSAAFTGIPDSIGVSVELVFPDGRVLDVTSDRRVTYTLSNNLIAVTEDGLITANEGTDLSEGSTVELTIQFLTASSNLSAQLLFEVVRSSSLDIRPTPYPPYFDSQNNILSELHIIEDTGVWQRASLNLFLLLTNGDSIDITSHTDTNLAVAVTVGDAAPVLSSEQVLSVTSPGRSALLITGNFPGLDTATHFLQLLEQPVTVSNLTVQPLPFDTLRGIRGTPSHQLVVDLSFSDGTQYLNYPTDSVYTFPLPGLLSFSETSSAFEVMDSGVLQPLANSIAMETVQVAAGSENGMQRFVVNLDPDIGDVDLGAPVGSPIPISRFGDELMIPVLVNTGTSNLGSIDITLVYNSSVLQVLEVQLGPDWGSGLNEMSVSGGEARFGGALNADGVVGAQLHIFTVRAVVVGVPPSGVSSSISGTVVTIAERSIDGAVIGEPTPRSILAGDIRFIVSGGVGRRSVGSMPLPLLLSSRGKRQALECTTPPCVCSGLTAGDTDGNCQFDIRDVTYALIYITESLFNFSQPVGQIIALRTSPSQLRRLDPTLDGIIDTNDAYFLLRAVFELVYFIEDIQITPVQDLTSNCLFTVDVQLSSAQNTTLGPVDLFIDIAFEAAVSGITSSAVQTGSLVTADKGIGLFGGIYLAAPSEANSFLVQLNAAYTSPEIGISIIMVTFDSGGQTSASRTVQFFGAPPVAYTSPLSLSLMAGEGSVLVAAPSGYSPLRQTSNSLLSSDCSDDPLLETQLTVAFLSPFQASLEWNLLNMRMGLDFTSVLHLEVMNCSLDQDSTIDNNTCTTQTLPVANNSQHTLPTLPFTQYWLQIQAPTSSTEQVHLTSPEAPPAGVPVPTFEYSELGVVFMWSLPTAPNGVITHYTLRVGSSVVFNGSALAFTLLSTLQVEGAFNYSLEAHNSAGSSRYVLIVYLMQ